MSKTWHRRFHGLTYHLLCTYEDGEGGYKCGCGYIGYKSSTAHKLPESKREAFTAQAKSENWKHQPTFCKRCLAALERGADR
jgi:hypothetical protein